MGLWVSILLGQDVHTRIIQSINACAVADLKAGEIVAEVTLRTSGAFVPVVHDKDEPYIDRFAASRSSAGAQTLRRQLRKKFVNRNVARAEWLTSSNHACNAISLRPQRQTKARDAAT